VWDKHVPGRDTFFNDRKFNFRWKQSIFWRIESSAVVPHEILRIQLGAD
jgi:hypothetical protein